MSNLKMKYIMIRNRPIIFLETWEHREIAIKLGIEDATSAGFVYFCPKEGCITYGESISLGLKSKPEDGKIINKYI